MPIEYALRSAFVILSRASKSAANFSHGRGKIELVARQIGTDADDLVAEQARDVHAHRRLAKGTGLFEQTDENAEASSASIRLPDDCPFGNKKRIFS